MSSMVTAPLRPAKWQRVPWFKMQQKVESGAGLWYKARRSSRMSIEACAEAVNLTLCYLHKQHTRIGTCAGVPSDAYADDGRRHGIRGGITPIF